MFNFLRRSKVVRKSQDNLGGITDTKTQWKKGQKVTVKKGVSKVYSSNRRNNQRWFKETPLPAPLVEKRQMLISTEGGTTKIAVLEGPILVEYYTTQSKSQSLAGNVYLGKVKNILPGMEAAFVNFGKEKNGVLYVTDINRKNSNEKIENLIKVDQEIVVQVVKDAMGEKGARLTGQVSFPGRFLVLIPNAKTKGISRRLQEDERSRLDSIIRRIKPNGFGLIVRTAAEGATEDALKDDIERLLNQWNQVQEKKDRVAPSLIHEEPDISIRVVREHLSSEYKKLLIDNEKLHNSIKDYLNETSHELIDLIEQYSDELPLFDRYHIDDQVKKALDRKVWLPSGGHLVIDRTEALTVIDVNTGKFVGKNSLDETVYKNNLEAAEEIARQLRLRDIGGIIVIDFIDMISLNKQQNLINKFREELAKDKTRTQVFDVSRLGLVEMTRKNVSAGLVESFSEECKVCSGRGIILDTVIKEHDSTDHNLIDSEPVLE